MTESIRYARNSASIDEIVRHLLGCDEGFVHHLTQRVELKSYSNKIFCNAERFEAWDGERLVGFVAVYCNDKKYHQAFLTNVSVRNEWMGKGIASHLMTHCLKHVTNLGIKRIELEVNRENTKAISLYEKNGFIASVADGSTITMSLDIDKGKMGE